MLIDPINPVSKIIIPITPDSVVHRSCMYHLATTKLAQRNNKNRFSSSPIHPPAPNTTSIFSLHHHDELANHFSWCLGCEKKSFCVHMPSIKNLSMPPNLAACSNNCFCFFFFRIVTSWWCSFLARLKPHRSRRRTKCEDLASQSNYRRKIWIFQNKQASGASRLKCDRRDVEKMSNNFPRSDHFTYFPLSSR